MTDSPAARRPCLFWLVAAVVLAAGCASSVELGIGKRRFDTEDWPGPTPGFTSVRVTLADSTLYSTVNDSMIEAFIPFGHGSVEDGGGEVRMTDMFGIGARYSFAREPVQPYVLGSMAMSTYTVDVGQTYPWSLGWTFAAGLGVKFPVHEQLKIGLEYFMPIYLGVLDDRPIGEPIPPDQKDNVFSTPGLVWTIEAVF